MAIYEVPIRLGSLVVAGSAHDIISRVFVKVRGSARRHVLFARLLWAAAPRWVCVATALSLVGAAMGTVLMVSTGQFVGALSGAAASGPGSAAADRAWFWLVVTGLLLVTGPLVGSLMGVVTAKTTAAYVTHVTTLIAETGVEPQGLELVDSPGFAGELRAVVDASRDWTFIFGADGTWAVLAQRLAGVGAFVVLLSWRWWVAVVVAASFAVLSLVFTHWVESSFDQVLQSSSLGLRRARYTRGLLIGAPSAKEVRIFGLAGWLADRYRSTWFSTMATLWPIRRRGLRPVYAACLAMAVTIGAALALLTRDVAIGVVGVGSVVTLIQAMLGLEAFGILGDQQTALSQSMTTANTLAQLRQRLGLSPTRPGTRSIRSVRDDRRVVNTPDIQFDAVTFTYPTRTEPTIRDLTLTIRAGQSVAIVGVNGAGKSTLIKLVAGLYRPQSGSIRVGGMDPASTQGAGLSAVIFQNFVRYQLPLRDNVWLKTPDTDGISGTEMLQRSLARAGASALAADLPRGLDTVLSPEYDDGVDLSGGQWQRVALARALAAVEQGARVLILDEPTSALDVRAEIDLFGSVLGLADGLTTILVSHRLSGARLADRIIVLDPEKGVVEDGTHEDLLRLGGQYARMFAIQASRFQPADATASADREYGSDGGDTTTPRTSL